MNDSKPRIAVHKFTSCDGCQLALVLDGVYRIEGGQPRFVPVAAPSNAKLARALDRIVKHILALRTRRGEY